MVISINRGQVIGAYFLVVEMKGCVLKANGGAVLLHCYSLCQSELDPMWENCLFT